MHTIPLNCILESQRRQISCGITYTENLKKNVTNELIYRNRLTDLENKLNGCQRGKVKVK